MRLFLTLFIVWGFATVNAEPVLYQSDAFNITGEAVREGDSRAVAVSDTEIHSNYAVEQRQEANRVVIFKFAINGLDNERKPFADHRVFLNPTDSTFVTPVFVFGQDDPAHVDDPETIHPLPPDGRFQVTFRVDMTHVLKDFEELGYFETYNGERIAADAFEGVYIAGGMAPLTWNFGQLTEQFKLHDTDNDGIFEVTLSFHIKTERPINAAGDAVWKLSEDVSHLPAYQSPHTLLNALYNLSLEEALLDIREDGAFMAGAKWHGVWTRDISYSIVLSLAAIMPEAAKTSLMAKVRDGIIIQDTGTGGSWPISSDRMTWALAAWEVYLTTGDMEWLKQSYIILKKSVSSDLQTVRDPQTGLFYGESSFLDWREQTYPRWMDPKDIYRSQNLGTNVVHYQTYRILEAMAQHVGESPQHYGMVADSLKAGINAYLWDSEAGYYGQFRYGRNHLSLSPRAEALGEALSILYDVADPTQRTRIINSTPVTAYGVPCIYPQIPDIPSYHNDGIWPFVVAYWTWAAAEAENSPAVEHGLASIYRAAALFLTNKENMVASNGNFMGTEINSDRQLWSVAGNLATIYRVFFGLRYEPTQMTLTPFVPEAYAGTHRLQNFPYRQATLDITLEGWGNRIASLRMDGQPLPQQAVPGDLTGHHTIHITLEADLPLVASIHYVENHFSPATPGVILQDLQEKRLAWEPVKDAVAYEIFRNGQLSHVTTEHTLTLAAAEGLAEYQVRAVDARGLTSFLSEPVRVSSTKPIIVPIPAEMPREDTYPGFTGDGYVRLTRTELTRLNFNVNIPEAGLYSIDVRYANGNGPINTDNKAAIRTLQVDNRSIGVVVMPQRGVDDWTNWGYSNPNWAYLDKGWHSLTVRFTRSNENMNPNVNEALLDYLRLTLLQPAGDAHD